MVVYLVLKYYKGILLLFGCLIVTTVLMNSYTIPPTIRHVESKLQQVAEDLIAMETDHKHLAIIVFLPNEKIFFYHFQHFLYASWKYTTKYSLKHATKTNMFIDLLVFTEIVNMERLSSTECNPALKFERKSSRKIKRHSCWLIEQNRTIDFDYKVLNSFIMFDRSDINEISQAYDFFLRTDLDTFISPSILTWQPKHNIVIGNGQYCEPFNQKRLKTISETLHLIHRGIHCVGSTWYGSAELITRIARRTFRMTEYIYKNEFKSNLAGLKSINLEKHPDGQWKRWYRGVSLLYASEIVLNDAIIDFSLSYFAPLDVNACSEDNILNNVHVHCWHDKCNFSKFEFADVAHKMEIGDKLASEAFLGHFLGYRDVSKMSVTEYCSYIAYNSLARYVFSRNGKKQS